MPMSGFICQDAYLAKLSKMTDEEIGRLFRALMTYHATGAEVALDGRESVAFDFIRDDVDRAEASYAEKCKRNRENRTGDNRRDESSTTVNDRQRPSTTDTNINRIEREIENKEERENIRAERAERSRLMKARFDRFWTAYPRHTAKANAEKAFAKVAPDDALLDAMLTAINRQRASPQWSDPQYIPHPATWLNQRRWEDEPVKGGQNPRQTVVAQQYHQREYTDAEPDYLTQLWNEQGGTA